MSESLESHGQLAAISSLDDLFARHRTAYWIFGGWAVDLHVGRVTRHHADIDIAVWASDSAVVTAILCDGGWDHRPEVGEDGYTCFERANVRLEVAFLARDDRGAIYTPLADGRGDWPQESFGDDIGSVGDVRARVVSRASLLVDKSAPRTDAATADKDRRDIASLQSPIVGSSRVLMFERTIQGALDAAAAGQTDAWVDQFLSAGLGANPVMAVGLRRQRRWWIGPIRLPIDSLVRLCGPEPDMQYRQGLEAWEAHVGGIMTADVEQLPPLILEYRGPGVPLGMHDGSHRHEALRRLGKSHAWTLVWCNSAPDFREAQALYENGSTPTPAP